MTALTNDDVTEARGLLAAVLDFPGAVSPQASLDLVQALCELAPDDALPTYPPTTPTEVDPAAALRTARCRLRHAIPAETDVDVVMRLAAAIRCLDTALQAVTREPGEPSEPTAVRRAHQPGRPVRGSRPVR